MKVVQSKRVFKPSKATTRWTQNRIDDFVGQARTKGLLEGTIGAAAVSSLRRCGAVVPSKRGSGCSFSIR